MHAIFLGRADLQFSPALLLLTESEMAKKIAVCVLEGSVKGTIRFEQVVRSSDRVPWP